MNRRSQRRLVASVGALSAAALVLAGCASTSDDAASPASSGTAHDGVSLVVYSNSVSDGRGEWLTDQAKSAGFDIQVVDLGGADLMNRLQAETANPIADVVFGLNQVYFEKLKAGGALAPMTPTWPDKVDTSFGDGKTYWPIVREPIMLVYNTDAWTTSTAPSDWPDLWKKPAFAGTYEVPTALGGATTQMVIAGILARYPDKNGALGVSPAGWEAIADYFAKGSPAVEGEDLYARMANGDVSMGQMWLAGKATREQQYDIQTTAVHPKAGVPIVAQSVAVVNGTKKAAAAEEFADWLGSADVQAAWSKKFFTAPTNADALADADQDAVTTTDSFTAQDIDWGFVAKNIDAWVEKVTLDYLTS